MVSGDAPGRRISPLLIALVIAIAAAGAAGTRMLWHQASAIEQPIEFNHALHVEGEGLGCVDCHEHVNEQEFAGRPTVEICASCHQEPMGDSAQEERVVAYIKGGEEIPWQRLYHVPDHVYYSHRRHVKVAGLECPVCHGDIGQASTPPRRPLKDLSMDFCIECHEARGASTDCNACHR